MLTYVFARMGLPPHLDHQVEIALPCLSGYAYQEGISFVLAINIAVYDVATGTWVAGGSVDIRGDTDESWTRGLSFLLRNRILGDGGK